MKCLFDISLKVSLFYYSTYFCYYLWVSLYFLVLFIGSTILFQLPFNFIYSTFSKKFSISTKYDVLKYTQNEVMTMNYNLFTKMKIEILFKSLTFL